MRIARELPAHILDTENGNVTDLNMNIRSLAALVAKNGEDDWDENHPYHLRRRHGRAWTKYRRESPLTVAKQMVAELLARLTAEYNAGHSDSADDEPKRFVPALRYGDRAYGRAMETVIDVLLSQTLVDRIADIQSLLKAVGLSAKDIIPIKNAGKV
jgi:hypothetical protein